MSQYTTGEIAKLCDVSIRTVQFYDVKNILTPTALSEGGRRLYSEDDLRKMKIICFLKELGFSLNAISKILSEKNSARVISLILSEQENSVKNELAEKQLVLEKLTHLRKSLQNNDNFSVNSIGDLANVMKEKDKLKKLHLSLILFATPFTLAEWATIILWIVSGIWWPFAVYVALLIPFAIWISKYYFKRIAYICPECHQTFKPKFKQAFWANHTPKTRKLTCPNCKNTSYCYEIYKLDKK